MSNARVVLAEYELLQHDFVDLRTETLLRHHPKLRDLDPKARDETIHRAIDEWLIANAAFISAVQAEQTVVNTQISVDGGVARGYRPPGYGRAIVVPVRYQPGFGADDCGPMPIAPGLLDLKGAGVPPDKVPSDEAASNGLEALWCALRDHLKQRAIDGIFAREIPTLWTVPTYAVLDLGFDMKGRWQGAPAGMHVRRAHRRDAPCSPLATVDFKVRLEIERLLRKYGLTSAHQGRWVEIFQAGGRVVQRMGGKEEVEMATEQIGLCLALKGNADYVRIEQVDIQNAAGPSWPPAAGQMVDFGTIHVRKRFDFPLCRETRISLEGIDWPNSSTFVQPAPKVALPIEIWNSGRINYACIKLARQFRCNELSTDELRNRLERPLGLLMDSWSDQQVNAES